MVALLVREHDEVKEMVKALRSVAPYEEGSGEVLSSRASMLDEIVFRLSAHEAAEEELFWPAVADTLDGGPSMARIARSQEREAKATLHELRSAGVGAPRFDDLLGRLDEVLRRHMAFEDSVLTTVLEHLPEATRRSLGVRVGRALEAGPTRPHPHVPSGAGVLHVVGPLVAVVDHARDRVSGGHARRAVADGAPTSGPEEG